MSFQVIHFYYIYILYYLMFVGIFFLLLLKFLMNLFRFLCDFKYVTLYNEVFFLISIHGVGNINIILYHKLFII